MIIKNIYIEGYGIYANQLIENLPAGLVVFAGQNESGKSTLMQFIRTVFYGNKPRTKNPYKPVRGGNFGGKLDIVLDDNQQYTIRRDQKGVTVFSADGTSLGLDPSKVWLGGLERETYESIFSVGLQDLQGLKLLESNDVKGRFFAAGVGLNAAVLSRALQIIEARLTTLLRQRGEAVIGNLLAAKKQIDKEIRDLEREDMTFAVTRENCDNLTSVVAKSSEELEQINQRLIYLNELNKARRPWAELQILQEKAQQLEYAKDFPPDGIIRYDNLLSAAGQLHEDIEAKTTTINDLKASKASIVPDSIILNNAAIIETLYKDRGKYESALKDLPLMEAECIRARENFDKCLRDIGSDWDEAKLAAADISVPVCQQVSTYAARYADIRAELRLADERERVERSKIKNEEARFQQLDDQLAEQVRPEMTAEMINEQEGAVKAAHTILVTLDNSQAKLSWAAQEELRLSAAEQNLVRRQQVPANIIPGFIVPISLVMTAVLACYLVFNGQTEAAGAICLLGLPAAWGTHIIRKRLIKTDERRKQEFAADKEQLQQQFSELKNAKAEILAVIENLEGRLADLCRKYNWDDVTNLDGLNYISSNLEKQRQCYQHWSILYDKVKDAEEKLAISRQMLESASQRKAELVAGLTELDNEWQKWLREKGFPVEARAERFDTVIKAVENARAAYEHWHSLNSRLENIKRYIEAKDKEFMDIAAVCGYKAVPSVNELDKLYDKLTDARAKLEKHNSINQTIIAAESDLAKLKNRLSSVARQFEELLAEAKLAYPGVVAEVPAFRRLAHDYKEWKITQEQIQQNRTALRSIAGSLKKENELTAELADMQEGQAAAEFEQLIQKKSRLETLIAETRDKIGRLRQKLDEMCQSSKLDEAMIKQQHINILLKQHTHKWLAYAVCEGMLAETREMYERERQPAVIKEADKLLKLMTNNRYRLITPDGIAKLEDKTGRIKDEYFWSSGLADQVYLAVRLCLAREYNKTAEKLPIILDDVLVKFDYQRQIGVMKGLLAAAQHQQILLFTCQEQLLEILRQVVKQPDSAGASLGIYNIADGMVKSVEY